MNEERTIESTDYLENNRYIEVATHAIGLGHRKTYTRHGKRWYRPYRNYFATSTSGHDFDLWDTMESAGYARSRRTENRAIFWLTRSGLDWLGKKLGIHIHDEEE